MTVTTRTSGAHARRLQLATESIGLDASKVSIQPLVDDQATSPGSRRSGKIDSVAMKRPAKRAASGAILGAALGLVTGLVAWSFTDLAIANIAIVATIAGMSIGALLALYTRLPSNQAAVEAPPLDLFDVSIDVEDLDESTVARIKGAIQRTEFDTDRMRSTNEG